MKVKQRRYFEGGMGGGGWYTRVVELAPNETIPSGAETVPDETPVHDWQPE